MAAHRKHADALPGTGRWRRVILGMALVALPAVAGEPLAELEPDADEDALGRPALLVQPSRQGADLLLHMLPA